ncbi:hypothetical protein [Paracoccus alkanivorans]|uniref:Uncharacterized protein n=1 Tax=Paracoccus alkanivorans TaxID=2116655 RepID=A0A3M0MDF7_9RHOB|nr:hypothetical protein [Paracoccus alkanivorans]RMC34354.1 hypothetical protein C9E81_14485 [Paracoccus alkanivorans]
MVLEHNPFSPELKEYWDRVVWSFDALLKPDTSSEIAIRNLIDYAITLMLVMHPHNYSDHFGRRETLSEKNVQKALAYIESNSHLPSHRPMSQPISDVARSSSQRVL